MKHRVRHNQLGRNTDQNKALRRGLVSAVFEKGKIETTLAKAKAVVSEIDRVMTFAKTDSVHTRRQVTKIMGNDKMLNQVFKVVAPMTKDRTSGFTRIIKLGPRFSDATDMAVLQLVDYEVQTLAPVAKTEEEVKVEKTTAEKPKLEKIKPERVQRAKPQTSQRPKKVGSK